MPSVRSSKLFLTALAALLVVSCADINNPLQPAEQPVLSKAGKHASGQVYQAVNRSTPQGRASTSAVIGQEGGGLSVAGVELNIPAGALDGPVKIRLTVPKNGYAEAKFAPHGLQFSEPATLSFDLSGAGDSDDEDVLGVYVGPRGLDSSGTAVGLETFQAEIVNERAQFSISHFSGYIVASGRSSSAF